MNPWIAGTAGLLYLASKLLEWLGDDNDAKSETHETQKKPARPSTIVRADDIAFYLTCQADSYGELQNNLPARPGIYAWYFDEIPGDLEVGDCFQNGAWHLLYVGKAKSLRSRIIGDHFNGSDATQSGAIRETIGALLHLQLFRKSSDVWTFGSAGEKRLSQWLRDHARVAWVSIDNRDVAWPIASIEDEVLRQVEVRLTNRCFDLPLNRSQERQEIAESALRAWNECRKRARRWGAD